MLKLLGIFLLTGGCTGFSVCLCREGKNRLVLLKEMKYLYQLLQSEILYSGEPLPEILGSMGQKQIRRLTGRCKISAKATGGSRGKALKESGKRRWKRLFRQRLFWQSRRQFFCSFPNIPDFRTVRDKQKHCKGRWRSWKSKSDIVRKKKRAGTRLL